MHFLGYNERKGVGHLYLEYCTEGDLCRYVKQDLDSSARDSSAELSPAAAQSDSSSSESSRLKSSNPDDSSSDASEQTPMETPSLSCQDIWSLLLQLASALAYCHHGLLDKEGKVSFWLGWRTILHRDLKPANGIDPKPLSHSL